MVRILFYFIPLCGAEDSPIHSLFRVRPFVHKFDPGPEVAEAAEEAAAVSAGVCIHLSTAMHQIQYKLWATNHLVLINISSCSSSNFKLCLSVYLSVCGCICVCSETPPEQQLILILFRSPSFIRHVVGCIGWMEWHRAAAADDDKCDGHAADQCQ